MSTQGWRTFLDGSSAKVHNSLEITKLLGIFYEKITKKNFLHYDT